MLPLLALSSACVCGVCVGGSLGVGASVEREEQRKRNQRSTRGCAYWKKHVSKIEMNHMLYAEHEKRKILTRRSQSNLHGSSKNHTQKCCSRMPNRTLSQLCRNSLQNHAGARGGKRLRTYRTVLTKTYGQCPQAPKSSNSQKHTSPPRVPESAQHIHRKREIRASDQRHFYEFSQQLTGEARKD